MTETNKKKLRILFNMLNTCVSQGIISLELSVSIKGDASSNLQFVEYYTNLYTKKYINHND